MTPKMIARWIGVLFLLGDVTGILSVVITQPSLGVFSQQDPTYLIKIGSNETVIIIGALLLLLMGLSLAFIPIVFYPLLKRFNETLAVGYLVFRGALETMLTIGMAVSGLLLVLVSHQYAPGGSAAVSAQALGTLIMGAHDQLNIVLQIVFPVGALMVYSVLYTSRLVPRWLSGWGLIGAILYLSVGVYHLFGTEITLLLLVLGAQEIVLALWLLIKGFNPQALGDSPPT